MRSRLALLWLANFACTCTPEPGVCAGAGMGGVLTGVCE
jgi:hypothetical protein